MTAFVEIGGRRFETLDIAGRGAQPAAILMLHEGLGSVSQWRDFPERLAQATGARVVAYSRLGFGQSSSRPHPYTPRFMHEEAHEVVPRLRAALGLTRPVLLGHSNGASMALLHAARDPGHVAGVVAIAPLIDVEAGNLDSIREARRIYETTGWRTKLARHHAHPIDGVFSNWSETWLAPGFRDWSITRELGAIRCEVLAIGGADDPYSSPRQLELVARGATEAGVETLLLRDCGHVPHRDQPEAVLEAIARFVARTGG